MAGVCKGECMGCSPGDKQLTLKRCHICGFPQLYEALEGWKSVCGLAYNLKYIKKEIFVIPFFLNLCFCFIVVHFMT